MGKKSRLKRERRARELKRLLSRASREKNESTSHEESFVRLGSQLEVLFSQYDAGDVCLSLGVSELWIPNISSQVKHYLALGVLASMAPERFVIGARIDTYDSFRQFIQQVYTLLPDFGMLEDYVPEADWGEVKMASQGLFLRLFYGNAIERIPDFIEAFRLSNGIRPSAIRDIHVALAVQDHVISAIDRSLIGSAEGISPGHIEIPAEPFWQQCRNALASASSVLAGGKELSPDLVIVQGSFRRPMTWSDFGEAVMTGRALPAILIDIGGMRYPIALRNALGAVADNWAGRTITGTNPDGDMTASVAGFLRQRIDRSSLFAGPFHLFTRNRRLPYKFAAVFLGEPAFQFVVVLQEKSLSILVDIEKDIRSLVASGEEWWIAPEGGGSAFQFRHRTGRLPGPGEVTILVALPHYVSSMARLHLPKTSARVLWLPDFITIFDSLEDIAELDRFWTYVEEHRGMLGAMSMGMADLFASFRDSHGVLVEGAVTPNFISLDPHWGSNWRYRQLTEYWKNVPPLFPDDTGTLWKVEPPIDGIQRLIARGSPSIAFSTLVRGCVVHFVFPVAEQNLDLLNGRMLELFVHCITDAIAQGKSELETLALFARRRIVTTCRAQDTALATEIGDSREKLDAPLFSDWRVSTDGASSTVFATVLINVARVQASLTDAVDARFEVECIAEWVSGLGSAIGQPPISDTLSRLYDSSSRKPRFTLTRTRRLIDVPDFASPQVPQPEQYKRARRDLAVTFKKIGATPGRYELASAKAVIDPARDMFRQGIHTKIAQFDRPLLLRFCIEQHDALAVEHRREVLRLRQSLSHEVNYDRSQVLAKTQGKFVREARNYQYLLECCLSMPSSGSEPATTQAVMELVASIDWLFTLYDASDVLHNDIEVAGVDLDNSYVPMVFYSPGRDIQEDEFSLEMADMKLGLDIIEKDKVTSPQEGGSEFQALDDVFIRDTGFSLTHLVQTFNLLSCWKSCRGDQELRLCYQALSTDISKALQEAISDITPEEANRLVAFATLEPSQVRHLLGKTVTESDVPVWDHTKRGSRYTIRPLIPMGDGTLAWGAACADRSFHIWTSSIANGYLPADFPWPSVSEAVRAIKNDLERQLEIRAFEICSRTSPHVIHGIDFKSRFPKDCFDDVGDFDVLAYWPETNWWLTVECKYNQPAFCIKDARRLRERIFGIHPDRGQFSKIERRRVFLSTNSDKIRELLQWPASVSGSTQPRFFEVYVSRDIYWWMRHPPYEVPAHFVRIDAFDNWLRASGFSMPSN